MVNLGRDLAKGRVRSKIPMLEQALQGLVREHHRRLLAMQLAHIDFLDEQIEALNAEIRRLLEELSQEQIPGEPAGPGTGDGRNEETSAMVVSFSQAIQLLDSVPGVDQKGAELVPCLCRMLLGRWCWSHGLTRAFCSLVRGDVVAAADFNLLVFPVVITMAAVCFSNLWREYGGASPQRGLRRVPFR